MLPGTVEVGADICIVGLRGAQEVVFILVLRGGRLRKLGIQWPLTKDSLLNVRQGYMIAICWVPGSVTASRRWKSYSIDLR
jgi:hypothetical protein